MSSSPTKTDADVRAIAAALRDHNRFLLVTHENPDGDALGSTLGLKLALDGLGKDATMYLGGDTDPPVEYEFLPLADLHRELPADGAQRVLVALDCANERRMGEAARLLEVAPLSLDVDHHHDNTRFARLNLVVPDASSTGEIVRDILRELGVALTPGIAEAIYVALVTDTGRFQYANTTPKALRLAAELVEAGVDVHRVFQGIYESVEFAKLKLLARALERAQIHEGGRLVISCLVRTDFTELGVGEEYAEGIIDYLRAVDGTEMAAVIREPPEPPDAARRVSLRASADELDVSAIARQRGGGGHRQAAGFSSHESIDEISAFIREAFASASQADVASRRAQPGSGGV
jgi:phosphoesterase RecJ-like protein